MKKRNYGNQGDVCSFQNVDRILTPVHMNGRDWSWFLQTRGQHMPWRMLWRWKADRMKGLNSWVKPWKTGRYDFFSCSTCALNFWTREISGFFVCNVCLFSASPPPPSPVDYGRGFMGGDDASEGISILFPLTNHLSYSIYQHDAIDITYPCSMLDVCHKWTS